VKSADASNRNRRGKSKKQPTQEHQARLLRELAEAREELTRLKRKLEHRPDFGLGQGSPDIYEWEMNLALRKRVLAKIASLEDALKSLDEGDYGICDRCGEQIEPERLDILPDTTLCIRCAQRIRY
jgi:RNA polymerase-binding transcription factor DksA